MTVELGNQDNHRYIQLANSSGDLRQIKNNFLGKTFGRLFYWMKGYTAARAKAFFEKQEQVAHDNGGHVETTLPSREVQSGGGVKPSEEVPSPVENPHKEVTESPVDSHSQPVSSDKSVRGGNELFNDLLDRIDLLNTLKAGGLLDASFHEREGTLKHDQERGLASSFSELARKFAFGEVQEAEQVLPEVYDNLSALLNTFKSEGYVEGSLLKSSDGEVLRPFCGLMETIAESIEERKISVGDEERDRSLAKQFRALAKEAATTFDPEGNIYKVTGDGVFQTSKAVEESSTETAKEPIEPLSRDVIDTFSVQVQTFNRLQLMGIFDVEEGALKQSLEGSLVDVLRKFSHSSAFGAISDPEEVLPEILTGMTDLLKIFKTEGYLENSLLIDPDGELVRPFCGFLEIVSDSLREGQLKMADEETAKGLAGQFESLLTEAKAFLPGAKGALETALEEGMERMEKRVSEEEE